VLDPWRKFRRLEGLCAKKGDYISLVCKILGEEIWRIGIVVGKISLLWVKVGCEWTMERPPFIVDL
jgi:hypothetical protein